MDRLVKSALEDNEELPKPQFKKIDADTYMPTPNKPKTPNDILAEVYGETRP